jgi:hypothetical protein
MRLQPSTAVWMVSAFSAGLAIAVATLAVMGSGERGTYAALQLTARFSFLLFLPAYAGGALAVLSGERIGVFKRNARTFGLAFASAHLVHLGLVAWLSYIGYAPPLGAFLFFGIAALCIYALALFSIGSLRSRLGPRSWWVLNTTGLNYIAYAFAADFLRFPLNGDIKHLAGYAPFAVLSVAGPLLRLAAFLKRLFLWNNAKGERSINV